MDTALMGKCRVNGKTANFLAFHKSFWYNLPLIGKMPYLKLGKGELI